MKFKVLAAGGNSPSFMSSLDGPNELDNLLGKLAEKVQKEHCKSQVNTTKKDLNLDDDFSDTDDDSPNFTM